MITTRAGTPVRPLGLAAYPGQPPASVRAAFDAGINLFFFYGPSHLKAFADLPLLLGEVGSQVVVATGSGSRSATGLERSRRSLTKRLGVDVVDLFFAEYINPSDDDDRIFGPAGVLDTLRRWRDDGRIRYVGASTHDGEVGRALVADGRVDVLMLRYNMAHRRVGNVVFPSAVRLGVSVVAFAATRRGTLLAGHPEWTGPVPCAAECYRYCLREPAVRVVLTAPTSTGEPRDNLVALDEANVSTESVARWNAYGDLVHGRGKGCFDTQWP